MEALKAHRAAQETEREAAAKSRPDTDFVFRTRTGAVLDVNNVRRDFRAIVRVAGVKGSWIPRELRHSFVSLMSAEGVHLENIARLVGHSSTNTTELVHRKELRPVITERTDVMGDLFTERASATLLATLLPTKNSAGLSGPALTWVGAKGLEPLTYCL